MCLVRLANWHCIVTKPHVQAFIKNYFPPSIFLSSIIFAVVVSCKEVFRKKHSKFRRKRNVCEEDFKVVKKVSYILYVYGVPKVYTVPILAIFDIRFNLVKRIYDDDFLIKGSLSRV